MKLVFSCIFIKLKLKQNIYLTVGMLHKKLHVWTKNIVWFVYCLKGKPIIDDHLNILTYVVTLIEANLYLWE